MRLVAILFMLFLSAHASAAPALQCQEAPALMFGSLRYHLSVNQLTPEIKTRTINLLLKTLDPNKQLLLKSDEKAIRESLFSLFDSMVLGDCTSLGNVWAIAAQRAQETLGLVKSNLANFEVDKTAKFQSDAKKRDYPPNAKAKEALIYAAVQVQVATLVSTDVALAKAKERVLKRYELSFKRTQKTTETQRLNSFMESFARALDPHSDYLSAEELDEFKLSMSLSLEGVGLRVTSEDGYTVVEEISPGTSAERSNAFLPQDKIIAVAQDKAEPVDVVDMDLTDVLKKIRGPKGTKVSLTVLREKGGKSETFTVELVRDKVDLAEFAARMVYQTRIVKNKKYTVAVINLPSFYNSDEKNSRDSYSDLKVLVDEAAAKKVDGIILDLSTNPGGRLSSVVKIAGLFIQTGPVVAIQNASRQPEVLSDEDPKVAFDGPLLVLTTRLSASASEILAGALKDYRRALIVGGEHTFGKGSVQDLIPLPEGLGMIKLTTQMYFLPGGESTQYKGVAANITVPSVFDLDDFSENRQDYALRPTQSKSFISTAAGAVQDSATSWKPVTDRLVGYLKNRSAARVKNSSEFDEIRKEVQEAKRDAGWISVAEVLNRAKKDKEKLKARREEARTAEGRQAMWIKDPRMQEALHIMEDWLTVQTRL